MRNSLILGGTGAMGRYLVDALSRDARWRTYVTSRSARQGLGNVEFIRGNARDRGFMDGVLADAHFDVIVDFMNYGFDEFAQVHRELLAATDHYVFLSSSRMYDRSDGPLVETCPRLLDSTADEAFLGTQRYALRKARQENMLRESGCSNYTIVRPYITYSDRRLQLGVYEKEEWLYRILNGKPVVLREEMLGKRTTMTYGRDVSRVLARVMDSAPLGGPVHVTCTETMAWGDVLDLYAEVIREETGEAIEAYAATSLAEIEELFEGGYNTKYDRLFDRSFDNSLAEALYGHVEYRGMEDGLSTCLREFIRDWRGGGNAIFQPIMWEYEALADRMLSIDMEMPEMDDAGRMLYRGIIDAGGATEGRFGERGLRRLER